MSVIPPGRTAYGVWSGAVTRLDTRPLTRMGGAWSGGVEPSTLRIRTSACDREIWSSAAMVVGEVQPMSRILVAPPDSQGIVRARDPRTARLPASYRSRLTTIRSDAGPRRTATTRETAGENKKLRA